MGVLEERNRIAREMHDGPAQVLGYLNTKVGAIRRTLELGDHETAATMLAELEAAARDAAADVRERLFGLHSSTADDQDLREALRSYAGRWARTSGVEVELLLASDEVLDRLPEMARLQLVRLVQEALSNVRKHARASRATVSLRVLAGEAVLEVSDDGRGFDPQGAGDGDPHLGLRAMSERAQAAGGSLSLSSESGRGTRVTARIPLPSRLAPVA
jgi:signal transduction histidine kinase